MSVVDGVAGVDGVAVTSPAVGGGAGVDGDTGREFVTLTEDCWAAVTTFFGVLTPVVAAPVAA